MSNPNMMQQWASAMSMQQIMVLNAQDYHLVIQGGSNSLVVLTNIGSKAHKMRYGVDNIIRPITCALLMSYGIKNIQMIEVASGCDSNRHDAL